MGKNLSIFSASELNIFKIGLAIIAAVVLIASLYFSYRISNKGDTRITQRMIIQSHPESYTIRTQLQYFDECWYIAFSWQKDVPWSKIAKTRRLQQTQAEEWQVHLKMVLREFYKQP